MYVSSPQDGDSELRKPVAFEQGKGVDSELGGQLFFTTCNKQS